MKIDLSSIFLVIMVVIPGLFAQRGKAMIVPKRLGAKGTSEELAEFVAFGLATHGVLAFLAAALAMLAGDIKNLGVAHYFYTVDGWVPFVWCAAHPSEAVLLCAGYIFLSFLVSHCLGLLYGALTVESGITARLLDRAKWPERFGVRGLLGERPIIYDLLNAQMNPQGVAKTIFIEAEMKDGAGFYSGQLSQFAIVDDNEPHRPVYLIDIWFKKERSGNYHEIEADGMLIDLADVAILLIKQVDPSQPALPEDGK